MFHLVMVVRYQLHRNVTVFREDKWILFSCVQVCMFQPASNRDEIVLKTRAEL